MSRYMMPTVLLKPHEMFICVYAGVTWLADGGQRDTVTHAVSNCMNKPECREAIYYIYPVKTSDINLVYLYLQMISCVDNVTAQGLACLCTNLKRLLGRNYVFYKLHC